MKKHTNLISGILLFIISATLIFTTNPFISSFPSQEVELSNHADFGKLLPGNLFIQEIKMKKNYLERVDLFCGKINNDDINENVILLVDESRQILFSKRFSSREIIKADYYPFQFRKPLEIGKGKKVFACLTSVDGDPSNCIYIPLNKKSTFGKFSVATIQNNDILATIANPLEITPMEGSIGVKTHETNNPVLNFSTFLLLILAGIIMLVIVFIKQIRKVLASFRLRPEYAFVAVAAVFGAIFLYITPPFQTPDEPIHFYRSYEISELNFFRNPDKIPKSLQTIAAVGERMKFKSWEKTSKAEILSMADIRLASKIRAQVETVNYTIPYIPQALGIAVSRIFSDSPVWFLYTGRIFNLLVAIGLIFLAIKITPVHKWLFFMLGVMPMTISQIASVSYDASTIGISFLLFALILRNAFSEQGTVPRKAIVLLFLLTILLALCKPPYFLIGLAFLIIPVSKIGSMKKFVLIATGLLLSALIVSQFWSSATTAVQSLFVSSANAMTLSQEQSGNKKAVQQENQKANQPQSPDQTQTGSQKIREPEPSPIQVSPFDFSAQKKFIFDNPIRYFGILVNSITKYMGLYMTSFVGLFGWNDTALPDPVVYFFIFMLIMIALINPKSTIKVGIVKKMILLVIFVTSIFLIETGLYLYSNLVGTPLIIGVQGRYFIPLAPLFFILFYQQAFANYIEKPAAKATAKPARGKTVVLKIQQSECQKVSVFQYHYLPWILLPFALLTLVYTIIMILNRFYIITC